LHKPHKRLINFNLEKSVKCEKDVQVIGLASVMKKCVVFAMDGEYAGIAGANSCDLIDDKHFFHIARLIKNLCRLS